MRSRNSNSIRWLAVLFVVAVVSIACLSAVAGTTERVSVSSTGVEGNGTSWVPSLSVDGRYVAFCSWASNLVPGDTNGKPDIFIFDRVTGQASRVSISSAGGEGNGSSTYPCISADGRYVAFISRASNLVPGDTNGHDDIFVHDQVTGETTCVSVSSSGEQENSMSDYPSISADGRYVAFVSNASNLVPGANGAVHIFVHDRLTGETSRVSLSSDGEQGNGFSCYPCLSADGRYVAFCSWASNLVPGDTNGKTDVFVHDRFTGETIRVSVSSSGEQGNSDSGYFSNGDYTTFSLSANGRYVVFNSYASNLVLGDTNRSCDVFVHDRVTGQTSRVSISSGGEQGDSSSGFSGMLSLSADGRYVAFESYASNLVVDDTNNMDDIFVHDRLTGETTRVSVSPTGEQGNGHSHYLSLSADGRYVAFCSWASNLVPGDTNEAADVFVHDRYLPGDTDHDGDVDLVDLGNLATYYGATSGATWEQGDFDGDGDVDLVDLGNLATYYGYGVPTAPLDFAADAAKLGLNAAKGVTTDESSNESKTETLSPVPGGSCIPTAIVLMMCLAGAFFWLGAYPRRKP